MLWIIGCSVFYCCSNAKKDNKKERMRRGKSKPHVMSNLLIVHIIAKRRVMGKEREKKCGN